VKKFMISSGFLLCLGLVFWLQHSPQEAPPIPTMDDIDRKIVELQVKFGAKPAHDFFADDGIFMNGAFQGQNLDERVIQPLVERIRSETELVPLAVLFPENPKRAGAMVVPLPQAKAELHALQTIFIESDHAFDGVILRAYGNHWMQFELMDAATAQASEIENWDIEEIATDQTSGS